jgi:PH domain
VGGTFYIMAHVQSGAQRLGPSTPSQRAPVPAPLMTPIRTFQPSQPRSSVKSGYLNLDTFSPVNKDGSFEFDRVLKSGKVHRRIKKKGAWKPSWKPAFLVLRPNLLSIYQKEDESGLRASVTLSDVTAVAPVKKTHTEHVFGVFTPSKNYHFQGTSAQDTLDWIERIRNEARVGTMGEVELASPGLPLDQRESPSYDTTDEFSGDDHVAGSVPADVTQRAILRQDGRPKTSTTHRRMSHLNEYSGNELNTSHSDFSDAPVGSLPKNMASSLPRSSVLAAIASDQNLRPGIARDTSQMGGLDATVDPERVIRQGWLQVLRSKGGVKQWKYLWVVLRPKTLSFYKNEQEYSTVKLFSMSSVIDAAEIDPVSRSKQFCLQLILEDKAYKCCAPDEDALAKWLGSLKSVFAKRQNVRHLTEAAGGLSVM